jgi:NitT/TauT family transport system substrate-binding protein
MKEDAQMKRLISPAVGTFFLVTVLSHGVEAQGPRKVKLTIPVIAHSMTPVYLAQAKGFFTEEGLNVDVTSTGGGGPDIRALIAGDVDFSFTTGDQVIIAYQEGKPLMMVSSGLNRVFINWAMHKEAAKSKGITESTPLQEKLKSLKGLIVGVTNPAALTSHLAHFVIRKAGYVPQQDVQVIPIGAGPTWLAAVENRKVDAALTAPPVPETAIRRGHAIMFINNAKGEDPSLSEFLMENLVARPETLKKDPDLVRRMVRALVKANKWALSSTPEQVAEALRPTFAKTDAEDHLAGVKSVLSALSQDGRTTEKSVQSTQDVLEVAGLLKKRVEYASIVTNDFLPK